jgi:hypothetical protein
MKQPTNYRDLKFEILIVDTDKLIEKIFEKLKKENKKARRKN